MSAKKLKVGERNWGDPDDVVTLPPEKEGENQEARSRFKKLQVVCLEESPYTFIVTNVKEDNEWVMQQEADGELTITKAPDTTRVTEKSVMAAVYRGWPHLQKRD